jgi:hypothetical protein
MIFILVSLAKKFCIIIFLMDILLKMFQLKEGTLSYFQIKFSKNYSGITKIQPLSKT